MSTTVPARFVRVSADTGLPRLLGSIKWSCSSFTYPITVGLKSFTDLSTRNQTIIFVGEHTRFFIFEKIFLPIILAIVILNHRQLGVTGTIYLVYDSDPEDDFEHFDDYPLDTYYYGFPAFPPRQEIRGKYDMVEFNQSCMISKPCNPRKHFAVINYTASCDYNIQVYRAEKCGYKGAIFLNPFVQTLDSKVTLSSNSSKSVYNLTIPSTLIGRKGYNSLNKFCGYNNISIVIVESTQYYDPVLLIILGVVTAFVAFVLACTLVIFLGICIYRCIKSRAGLLSKWKVKKLPVHVFKKGDLYESCAICLEDYTPGEKLRILPCAHAYHCKCVDVWLTENKKTCPLCNDEVDPRRKREAEESRIRHSLAVNETDDERAPLLSPSSEPATSSRLPSSAVVGDGRNDVNSGEGASGGVEVVVLDKNSKRNGARGTSRRNDPDRSKTTIVAEVHRQNSRPKNYGTIGPSNEVRLDDPVDTESDQADHSDPLAPLQSASNGVNRAQFYIGSLKNAVEQDLMTEDSTEASEEEPEYTTVDDDLEVLVVDPYKKKPSKKSDVI